MGGPTLLKKIIKYYAIPVIISDSQTQKSGKVALEALSSGALDIVSRTTSAYSAYDFGEQLAEKIRAVAGVKVGARGPKSKRTHPQNAKVSSDASVEISNRIIAIGASTGGPKAITTVLEGMPPDSPGISIVQHMPPDLQPALPRG